MIERRAVSRYASALFGLAKDANELRQMDSDLLQARELVEKHSEISHLVLNSSISRAEKEDFIEKIMPPATSKVILNFLKVLIDKKRFAELVYIQEEFRRLFEKKQGIREVEAITAIELSRENEAKLIETLKKKLRSEIRLITQVDPDLIGGIILRFEGHEINSSYRARLDELRQQLTA
jgi:F-type H+-transporting ATPase subunit delta